ncbi:MAG: transposase, partial [Longimicrobiales bacterium]|nr:transposase [Longimicrobiales bacterium]
ELGGSSENVAVKDHLPDAVMVFDHFHVVKLMNHKLADLRRELQARRPAFPDPSATDTVG